MSLRIWTIAGLAILGGAILPLRAHAQEGDDAGAAARERIEEVRRENAELREQLARLGRAARELRAEFEEEREARSRAERAVASLRRTAEEVERRLHEMRARQLLPRLERFLRGAGEGLEDLADDLLGEVPNPFGGVRPEMPELPRTQDLVEVPSVQELYDEMQEEVEEAIRARPELDRGPIIERDEVVIEGSDPSGTIPSPGSSPESAGTFEVSPGRFRGFAGDSFVATRSGQWYRVRTDPGTRMTIRVSFEHDEGDIDVQARTDDGESLGGSYGIDDEEVLEVTAPASGEFLLRVHSLGPDNEYHIQFRAQ